MRANSPGARRHRRSKYRPARATAQSVLFTELDAKAAPRQFITSKSGFDLLSAILDAKDLRKLFINIQAVRVRFCTKWLRFVSDHAF